MDKVHITIQPGQKVWFTSDLHIGHSNVITFCNRPFADIKEMNIGIAKNWNDTVGDNDIVFVLGDVMWWESRHDALRYLNKLKGKEIHIIPGNHDTLKTFDLLPTDRFYIHDSCVTVWFNTINNMTGEASNGTNEVFLCHFPLATWPHCEKYAIHLYGHIHSNRKEGDTDKKKIDVVGKDLFLKDDRSYDVGVDNNNYRPIELRDIYKKLDKEFR